MHISHDFIATKSCPKYEFLVVLGWSAGRVRAQNFNPCRTLLCTG